MKKIVEWIVMLCLIFWAGILPSWAATIIVTATDGTIGLDGLCSISEAITSANADIAPNADCISGSGTDTILLNNDVTLTAGNDIANGTPSITSIIILNGQGFSIVRSEMLNCNWNSSNEKGEFRLMYVDTGGDLAIQNLTLKNGCADGTPGGGALYNSGVLTMSRSKLLDNYSGGSGGGIRNEGTTTMIMDSIFSGNVAGVGGGGLYNHSGGVIKTIANSIFSDNWIASFGAGIHNTGFIDIISNSTFSNNDAPFGGGIYIRSGTLNTISNSTFSNNSAAFGGGVYIETGTLNLISNSTFSGNTAANDGGAIYNGGNLNTVSNSTFSDSSAGRNGGVFFNHAIGIIGAITNNIITNTTLGVDCFNVFSFAASNNLSSDRSCPGDIGNVSHFDITLRDNGCIIPGPDGCVKTHALLAGSNAINNTVGGTTTDQRGFDAFAIRDIGAYEYIPSQLDHGCFPYTPNDKVLMICW